MSKETFTGWRTPSILFEYLNKAVGFNVDAAADASNHLLPNWYGPDSPLETDALAVENWLSPAYCNPPYGKGLDKWLKKFVEQQKLGNTVVALLPANTEVGWWYKFVVPYADILFLVGRVPFEGHPDGKKTQPDHASAIVMYSPFSTGRVDWLDWKTRIKEINGSQSNPTPETEQTK